MSAKNSESVVRMVEGIVEQLVDHVDQVNVTFVDGTQSTVIAVNVARADVPRVIGKEGDTANAIRTLLARIGGRVHRRYVLEVIEPPR